MSSTLKSTTNKAVLSMKTQILGDHLLPSIKKKTAVHSKNPYKVKKTNPFKKIQRPERVLDGFFLLEKSQCEFPHEVVFAKLSNRNLIDIVENDMAYFENLTRIDLSENSIRDIKKISSLKALARIDMQNNGIEEINFEETHALENLQEIDLAYNKIEFSTISNLYMHKKLRSLNLMGNEIASLPIDLSWFESLEVLNLSCNRFESNQNSSQIWASIASIPKLKDLDISRNLFRGIHTEKLIPGNFNTIERLDFSYNKAENQHNLICTRNFKNLKVLIVTGNPFAYLSQHKGLEKEIYMRVGAILINDNIDVPYLKKQKKAKQPIKFNNLYTIQPDDIKKEAKNTFFGVELPQEEAEEVEKPETPIEQEEPEEEDEDDDEDQRRFFITEDERKKKKKPQRYNDVENQIMEGDSEKRDTDLEELKEGSEQEFSDNKGMYSPQHESGLMREDLNMEGIKSLEDFKKVANAMIGDSKDYENPVEVNTAYKMLRQAMKKTNGNEKTLETQLSKGSKIGPYRPGMNGKTKHNTVQARMLDVEFLIDELNKKMSAAPVNDKEVE